jgi:hypothetical protein
MDDVNGPEVKPGAMEEDLDTELEVDKDVKDLDTDLEVDKDVKDEPDQLHSDTPL